MSQWLPSLQDQWNILLDGPPGLVCFDFDNSLIRGDFGETVMDELLLRGYPHGLQDSDYQEIFRDPISAKLAHQGNHEKTWLEFVFQEYLFIRETQGLGVSYRWSSFIFFGWKEDDLRTISRDIWLDHLATYQSNPKHYQNYPLPKKMAVHPREPVLKFIQEFQSKNWEIKIVTASPTWVVQEATQELGLHKTDVMGMDLVLDENQRTTRTIIEPYPYGDGKVLAIEKNLGRMPDIVFGDSINDLPMLISAKKQGVLFDRGYEDLTQDIKAHPHILLHPWI